MQAALGCLQASELIPGERGRFACSELVFRERLAPDKTAELCEHTHAEDDICAQRSRLERRYTYSDSAAGFATAISDGVLAAFIPFLEVLPSHQRRGIGTGLIQQLLAQLDDLYMVDVACDAPLEPFYARLGFARLDRAVGLRRREKIA